MMQPTQLSYTPVTQAANNIALSQTPGAAGNLTLAGALAAAGVIPDLSLGYIVAFTSGGDLSGRTFTITGTDADGKAQSEAVTGPSGATVVSTKFYRTIASIAVDAACGAALTVGTVNTTLSAVTPTQPVGMSEPYTSMTAHVTGTINFTLQKASERVNATPSQTPNWRTLQAAGAVDVEALQTGPIGALRGQINTYTNGATIRFNILQTGFGRLGST